MSASSIDVHISSPDLKAIRKVFVSRTRRKKALFTIAQYGLDLSNAVSNAPLAPLRAQTIIVKVVYCAKVSGANASTIGHFSQIVSDLSFYIHNGVWFLQQKKKKMNDMIRKMIISLSLTLPLSFCISRVRVSVAVGSLSLTDRHKTGPWNSIWITLPSLEQF